MIFEKGQSAIEFIIIVGAVTLFFLGFLIAIQSNLADKRAENIDLVEKEIALNVQNEISIASNAIDGYYRNFSIPPRILDLDYNIRIVGQTAVYINTTDGLHGLSLPVANVTGDLIKGGNVIQTLNRTVYLNR